jgi:thiol-disulfide isomerase/thioredoxin
MKINSLNFTLLLVGALCRLPGVSGVNLTPDNWDEVTSGKSVFVKFFASWCGHCKKMKPAWDELMKSHEGNPYYVIGDVECSANDTMQAFCKKYGVKGYPTLFYGDPSGTLEKYAGKRDLDSLQLFVQTNLKPLCSAANQDVCTTEQKELLQAYKQMSDNELEQKIKQVSEELTASEQDYTATKKRMEEEYLAFQTERTTSLSLMKSVLKANNGSGKEEL